MSGARIDLRLDTRERGTVAYLTVDNRAKLNTLDSALMTQFIGKVEALATRDDLRALVLAGAGDRAFIGGASIPEMAALDRDSARDFITLVHRTCDCLRRLPVPVIAAIDGYALGAGLEVAVSCDLRVATDARQIRHAGSESRHSIGGGGSAHPAPDRLWPRARIVDAGRDRRCRHRVALGAGRARRGAGGDRSEVETIVASLLAAGAQAVRRQKRLMREWEQLPVDRAIAAGIDAFARSFDGDEPREMMNSFLKRQR